MRHAGWVAAFALGLGTAPALADEVSPAVARWQAGVICPAEFEAGGRAAGEIPFIARTQVVPAVVGIGFGVKAQAAQPEGIGGVTVTVVHPPLPASGATQSSFGAALSGSVLSGALWRFDSAGEIAPGTWRFVAQAGGVTLYDISFEVVLPRAGDGLLRACGAL